MAEPVDTESLRAKYAALAFARDIEGHSMEAIERAYGDAPVVVAATVGSAMSVANSSVPATSATVAAALSSQQQAASQHKPGSVLERMSICRACNGLGVVKVAYNHMVLDKTCSHCEGEGVVTAPPPAAAPTDATATETEASTAGADDGVPPLEDA